jgi:hypothetical protein
MLWVKAARMSIEGRAAAACSGRNPLLPPTQMEPPTSPESNPRTVGTLHQPSEAIPPYPLLAINVSSLLRLAPLTVHVPSPCWLPAGAEELKERLAGLGLKCGGTPRQRAERLWALRGSSLEALDPKHFAKGAAPTAAAANPEEVAKRQQVSVFWGVVVGVVQGPDLALGVLSSLLFCGPNPVTKGCSSPPGWCPGDACGMSAVTDSMLCRPPAYTRQRRHSVPVPGVLPCNMCWVRTSSPYPHTDMLLLVGCAPSPAPKLPAHTTHPPTHPHPNLPPNHTPPHPPIHRRRWQQPSWRLRWGGWRSCW